METADKGTACPNLGYPDELEGLEQDLINARRDASNVPRSLPAVGLGLSGGGVRSATFCLGVFQGMSAASLLRRVDFLSTVSGGGYWGGCFMSLFARNPIKGAWSAVEGHLGACSKLVPFLRNNGNYLAPNGGADRMLFGAVLLRNWLALQLMVWGVTVLFWLCSEVPSRAWEKWLQGPCVPTVGSRDSWCEVTSIAGSWLYEWSLSPWFIAPAVAFTLGMFPLAWAYWTVGASNWVESRVGTGTSHQHRLFSWQTLVEVNFGGIAVQSALTTVACASLSGIARDVALWCICAAYGSEVAARPTLLSGKGLLRRLAGALAVFLSVGGQLGVSQWLSHYLSFGKATEFLTFFAIAAASFYIVHVVPSACYAWLARRVDQEDAVGKSAAIDRDNYARYNLSVWFQWLTVFTSGTLLVGVLHTGARLLHGLARGMESPLWVALVAGWAGIVPIAERVAKLFSSRASSGSTPKGFQAWMVYAAGFVALLVPVLGGAVLVQAISHDSSEQQLGQAVIVVCGIGVVIGISRYFLNNSSHLPLYSARITRTFLGAGRRVSAEGNSVSPTHTLSADDLSPQVFWDPRVVGEAGAPLHFINVTVNETVDGRTQLQNKERRGIGMALGPCAVSLGVHHHVIQPWQEHSHSYCSRNFRVFDYYNGSRLRGAFRWRGDAPQDGPRNCKFHGDPLTIGTWLGISGAAFSTGIGWRTNLGLSLLTGLFNIRLGHWWRSRVHRPWSLSRILGPLFWVQQYYLRELFARFPGTANSLWYLSDGGHFENMGGYELLRRRCPIVIIVDAEADGKYEFEGLGGLVRKARIDFDTHIEFLSHSEEGGNLSLAEHVRDEVLRYFGDLSHLARGTWKPSTDLPLPPVSSGRVRYRLEECQESGLSLAHAALARIRYSNGEIGWLIYLKPTLVGDEPQDICRYHVEHPSFPHESTLDQFFGEAQFESYRYLGEHIARKLFAHGLPLTQKALDELKPRPDGSNPAQF